jgi:cobalt-zinc-cadmium efflux system membrane fusion protein
MTTTHPNRHWPALPIVALCSVILVFCGCQSAGSGSQTPPNSSSGAELFTIPPDQMAHVQVMTVQPTTLQRSLRLTGAVAYNSFHTTPVITQVGGPVSRIAVAPGENVKKGQIMFYVASPDFSQLRTNYLKAKDAYRLAQREYARAQDLYAHHAIAEKDMLAAESAQVQAGGDLAAAESALKVMGVADPDELVKSPPSFDVPVRAPINGEVVEQDVSAGQLIQAGTTQCFMVSDISTVWVLVNIYQKDLPFVHMGDVVAIQTDSYPDVFHGRISYIAPALDPNTRTLQARIETNNPGGKLKRDMYVVATVNAGNIKNALTVPDAAVLRDTENQPFVYAQFSANEFGRRGITLGESRDGTTEITSGLKAGDHVIADGSLFLQFANSLQR